MMDNARVVMLYWRSFLNDYPGWWYNDSGRSPSGEFN